MRQRADPGHGPAALILLAGALGDRYGRRRIFLVGIAGFTIASIMCAVVPTMSSLIVARILQGSAGLVALSAAGHSWAARSVLNRGVACPHCGM
ncbi:MFS transporter [Micromonospora sp. 4G57]|uniref:MFS transporter n=1 Tax=Micromonospora sicca TaxID=2202420 RepID=A0ABU5JMI6_9ACTN|nr:MULTISPECIES: MFS transporter [unclassified Micromonospora]MDZ5446930.1 MFS transporter [Micromonospora sp. 4G57]MDZ5493608.1 MFS transporter [Micromonospora sp. 4G53]